MKRLMTLTLMVLLFAGNAQALERTISKVFNVEVEALDAGGKSDQNRLKEKAVLQAKDSFPYLVEGVESMTNGDYTQMIESATIVYAKPEILESALSAKGLRFLGKVEVVLDIEKSLKLLGDLQKQKELEAKVSEAVAAIMDLTSGEMNLAQVKQVARIRNNLEVELLMLGDVKSAELLAKSREDKWVAHREELFKQYAQNATWSITKINQHDKVIFVEVIAPDVKADYDVMFAGYDADTFGRDVQGELCGLSRLGLHFKVDALPVSTDRRLRPRNKPAKRIEFEFPYNGLESNVEAFRATFKVMPCY